MSKKITAAMSKRYRKEVIEALECAHGLLVSKSYEIYNKAVEENGLSAMPPEAKKYDKHAAIIAVLKGRIQKEAENEKNRKYQAKRRKEKKNKLKDRNDQ